MKINQRRTASKDCQKDGFTHRHTMEYGVKLMNWYAYRHCIMLSYKINQRF